MNSNGSAQLATPSNAQLRTSKTATPRQPSLPVFVSTRHAATDRPAGARGRLQNWEHLSTDEVIRRGAKASAEADASRGVTAVGNLMMVVMVIFSLAMAGAALHQEAQLEREAQQLHRSR